MTYGQTTTPLRSEVVTLLGHHRVLQRVGGPGPFGGAESSTWEEKQALGLLIRRYRHSILVWCRQGLWAVSDKVAVERVPVRRRTPLQELQVRLADATRTVPGQIPLMAGLSMRHRFELLSTWQRAAAAAAVGEHDFAADVNRGWLSPEESDTVVRDVTAIVKALVVLDARYDNIAGWERIPMRHRIGQLADQIRVHTHESVDSSALDARGHRPPPAAAGRVVAGGMQGAVIAQRHTLEELTSVPHALNLRRILLLQAQISVAARNKVQATEPDVAAAFETRGSVYLKLVAQTRNVVGRLGGGADAVVAAERTLRAVSAVEAMPGADQVRQLRQLCTATDARIASLMEQGAAQKLYLVGVPAKALSDRNVRGVLPLDTTYVALTDGPRAALRELVRDSLPAVGRCVEAPSTPDHRARLNECLSVAAHDREARRDRLVQSAAGGRRTVFR